jgi:hypothetical protein
VVKYLAFNELVADSHKRMGVNPKYLTTAESCGISFEISPFENWDDLLDR